MALLSKLDKIKVEIPVYACNQEEALEKADALKDLSALSLPTLKLLVTKSKKPGIEKKLKTYQSMI